MGKDSYIVSALIIVVLVVYWGYLYKGDIYKRGFVDGYVSRIQYEHGR